ncbi:MAG: Small-conductance mechanosensitive channel MscMJ [Methanomassiliicoccales archaeon PtaU1.Bin124]|nr:MAG: Small-conductance mechanosensitive channel MscMJ [Methanomassiliicoccales archaeon PtaU1.Bin124]
MHVLNAKGATLSRIGLALIAVMVIMSLSGPAVNASEVNILDKRSPNAELDAEQSITFTWIIYNNGTDTVAVKTGLYTTDSGGLTIDVENDFVTLDANGSAFVSATFTASRDAQTRNAVFLVNFTTTNLANMNDVHVTTKEIDLRIVSIWGVNAGQNKILGIWDNNLPAPLNTNEGAFIVTALIWIAIGLLFYFVLDPAVKLATAKTKTELDDIMLRILRMPIFLYIVLIGMVGSLEILVLSPDVVNQIETWYHVLLIGISAWMIYKIYDEVVLFYAKRYASKTETEFDDVLVPVLEKLGMILIPFVALMLIFEIFGYDVTVLLAGAGFLGIVVGYAAQSTLANFFAGIQLLVSRPFNVGDKLLMENGDFMEVKRIGLRATEMLDTTNNQLIIIPNDNLANNKIINAFAPDKELTVTVVVGVAYGSDIEKVKRLMVDAFNETPNSVKNKVPVIRLSEFADSSINMKIFIPIDDANAKWKAASDFREILYQKFKQSSVEIPFPQHVVYIKNDKKE